MVHFVTLVNTYLRDLEVNMPYSLLQIVNEEIVYVTKHCEYIIQSGKDFR